MNKMNKTKLNVGGREYNIPIDILNKIPYFTKDSNLTLKDDEIFISRSPLIFEHVISYVLDLKYPFPVEYSYELDFYNIEYDKSKLFNPYKSIYNELFKHITTINNNIITSNNNIITSSNNNNQLFKHITTVSNDVRNVQTKTNQKLNNIEDNTDCVIQ